MKSTEEAKSLFVWQLVKQCNALDFFQNLSVNDGTLGNTDRQPPLPTNHGY